MSEPAPGTPAEVSLPASPDRSAGRRLRALVGVREDVLDWAPQERPRYTKMGAIVLVTSILSGLSMLVVTTRLFPGPWSWLLALGMAAFWAFAILMLDSWLISSLHGVKAKALVCLPRLLISVLLGFAIAEPLVILVFRPAVDQEVADLRNDELAAYTSEWRACNPTTGAPVDGPECADRRLNLSSALIALRDRRDNLTTQRDKLKGEVEGYLAQWNELERIARAECSGEPGAETTGVPGEGPECTRNRDKADQYRRDTKLNQRQADLADLDRTLVELTASVERTETQYGGQVSSAIEEKVAQWRESRQTTGILEEIDALGRLADERAPVDVAQWVVRLLLVLFDCMPVLVKWMGGTTAYDERIAAYTKNSHHLHGEHLRKQRRTDAVVWEAHHREKEQGPRARRERIDDDARADSRRRDQELEDEIERLAEFYRNEV